uniref:RING-type domain-containing protein n=1 Tax=Gouania willdenowi TaxID=441366 RepID=A0A8C5H148_GOUWI
MLSPKPEDLLAHELSCPICFQLYSDPVALPCGHNYCRDCIHKAMQANRKGASTCPECRSEFQGVECLQKNFKLCGIIQSYKAISTPLDLKQEKAEHNIVKVSCDYCVDEPALAVKTCLTCDMSLCSRHLQRHQEKKGFSSHSVVEPVDVLGGKGCSIHGQLLEYFCSNDMACLCTTCILEGHHENHDVLTLGIAEVEMRRALESNVKVQLLVSLTVHYDNMPSLSLCGWWLACPPHSIKVLGSSPGVDIWILSVWSLHVFSLLCEFPQSTLASSHNPKT